MAQPLQINQILPVALKSQALEKQEISEFVTGDEKKLSVALLEPRIREITQDELKKCIKYAMVIVGLRAQNYPGDLEKQVLLNFIQDNYGGHTPAEIKLAFEMAITRKLEVEANCYENFSVAYFVSIMEAYRAWAREQIKLLPAPIKKRLLTAKEKLDINLIWALKCLNEINKLPCRI